MPGNCFQMRLYRLSKNFLQLTYIAEGIVSQGDETIYNYRVRKVDTNGIITIVAGTGKTGGSKDGGSATEAKLISPFSIATDRTGSLYITDQSRIRKVESRRHYHHCRRKNLLSLLLR